MTLTAADRAEAVERCLNGGDPSGDLERMLFIDARGSLASMIQQLWSTLEPGTPLEWRWHLDLICRELEMVTSGQTRELVMCIPPGSMKSLIGSVFWPSHRWLLDPSQRLLALSSSEQLATRDSWKMRMVVTSEWYRRLVRVSAELGLTPEWELTRDQNQKVNFVNSSLGSRQCFSTGGSVLGHRGGGYVVDDPHQLADILGSPEQVAYALGKAHEKVDVVLPTRVNDQRTAWRVLIQQRLHEDDCAGRALKRPEVRKVVLPMHAFDHDHPWRHPEDPREPGELLDPVRMPESVVQELYARLETVPGQGRAQLEQEPVPPSGGLFKRDWMRQTYEWDPQRPPTPYTEVVTTVDASFKASKHSAFVSIQTWARQGWTKYFLLDEEHERMSYVDTKIALRRVYAKWKPAAMLIEEKANGAALIDDLQNEIPCIVPFVPDRFGDKVARAQLSTPMWQGGGVWLPNAVYAPFVGDWSNEIAGFPGSINRDRVDAKTQLFLWWAERRGNGNTTATLLSNMRGAIAGR